MFRNSRYALAREKAFQHCNFPFVKLHGLTITKQGIPFLKLSGEFAIEVLTFNDSPLGIGDGEPLHYGIFLHRAPLAKGAARQGLRAAVMIVA